MTKDAVESVRPQDQKATKAPLVYIDLTPRKANDTREEDAAPAVDVTPTNETEGADR
jgi:hypothetical protein